MKKIIPLGIVFAVAVFGAVLAEYVLEVSVLGLGSFLYVVAAGAAAAVIVFITSRKLRYAVAALIGVLLIPYVVFGIGQVDVYMVDDNLARGITVVEVRPTMNAIAFGTPSGGSVNVWKGPITLKLHPGANRVKLGRFEMPAGSYRGGNIAIGTIEVDIKADFAAMVDPSNVQAITPEQYAEVFDAIKPAIAGSVTGFEIKLVNASLSGSVGKFTITVEPFAMPIPVAEFTYPGIGGPDITVDIVLDEMGRPDPSKIRTIVELPPGVGRAFPEMPGIEFR